MWLNDLERDARYAKWPIGLKDLLQPSFGGQVSADLVPATSKLIYGMCTLHYPSIAIGGLVRRYVCGGAGRGLCPVV